MQHSAAFSDDSTSCFWIESEVTAQIIRSAEKAIVRARDRVHERRVIADDRTGEIFDSRHGGDLATMRLEIHILHKFARADSCAVDHEIERAIDILEFFEMHISGD